MPLQKGHKSFNKNSTTPTLINLELRQISHLAAIAGSQKRALGDRYQALGMMLERLEEIDRRFCACYYDSIPEGLPQKSYEELTEKTVQLSTKMRGASASKS